MLLGREFRAHAMLSEARTSRTALAVAQENEDFLDQAPAPRGGEEPGSTLRDRIGGHHVPAPGCGGQSSRVIKVAAGQGADYEELRHVR